MNTYRTNGYLDESTYRKVFKDTQPARIEDDHYYLTQEQDTAYTAYLDQLIQSTQTSYDAIGEILTAHDP